MRKFIYSIIFIFLAMGLLHAQVMQQIIVNAQPPSSGATVSFGTNSPATICHTTNSATLTCNLTGITSISNMLGVAAIGYGNSPASVTITSVTWCSAASGGGTCIAMSAAGALICNGTNLVCTAGYVLAAPATGTPSIVLTLSTTETEDLWIEGVTFSGANQTTPVRSGSYQTAGGSNAASKSITITGQTGDMDFSVAATQGGTNITTTQTIIIQDSTHGARLEFGLDRATSSSGGVTHTWAWGNSAEAAVCGFAIAHA
jgi:hypothetical protein